MEKTAVTPQIRAPRPTRLELVRPPEGGPPRFMEVECHQRTWQDLGLEALEMLGMTVLGLVRRLPRWGARWANKIEGTCHELRRQCTSSF